MVLNRDVEVSSSTEFFLEFLDGRSGPLYPINDSLWNIYRSFDIITLFRLRYVEPIHDRLFLFGVLGLLGQPVVQQDVTRFSFHILNTVARDVRHLDQVSIRLFCEVFNLFALIVLQLVKLLHIDLGKNNHEGFGLEEWLDRLKESNLLVNGVSTTLRNVEEEKNGGVQVSQSRDCLHLNGVSLIEWVVQDSGRVDHLPASILVIGVTHKQILGCESIRLHIHIGVGDIIDEAGFANIRETGHNKCPRVCINLRQS